MGLLQWVRARFGKQAAARDNYAATYGNGSPGGFAGGGVGRLTASLATWSGAINADLDASLVVMRARARQLAQSNEHGRRFLSLVATNIVGATGPKLQVRAMKDQRDPNKPTTLDKAANDAIEIHYARWAKTADITGRMDLAHLYRTAVKAVARDGEAILRIVRRRDLPYGIALQLLDADRLDESINVTLPRGIIRQGVELDATGRPIAYWIKTRHPGDRYATGSNTAERVPVADIRHLMLPERAEQIRGYTWFHAIILRSSQLHGFNDAAVVAARIGASKIAALERAEESPDVTAGMADSTDGRGGLSMNIEAGELFELPPGYKLSSWNPEYPHANFESFVKAAMRGIATGLDVATHNLSGDMTDVNYSSARIAELSERDHWIVLQSWFIFAVAEPIYQEWLAIAMLRGDIKFDISGKSLPADKLQKFAAASRFQGRRWSWVDPAKEIDAAKTAVELGVLSRTRIAAEHGDDIEDVLDELETESTMLADKGLDAPAPAPKPPAVPPAEADADPMKSLRAEIRDLETRLARLRDAEPRSVHIHQAPINVAAAPPAEVRNEITVQPAAAPEVTVVNQIPEQPAPQIEVRLEATLPEQPAPIVNVQVDAVMPDKVETTIVAMPARETTTQIARDSAGNIKTSTQVERDA